MLDETHRQTGRTTRMLEEAKQLAMDGHKVIIMAANSTHAHHLRYLVSHDDGIPKGRVIVRPVGKDFDWKLMRPLHGVGMDDRILVDHYTAEDHHRHILSAIHKYDKKEEE